MSVVDHLVDDLVDEHKVLADALLIEHATVVTEDLHHAIDDVQDGAWSNICLTCCNKVDAKLLCKEVIDTVHVLNNHIAGLVKLSIELTILSLSKLLA